jgi:hypothetical protein
LVPCPQDLILAKEINKCSIKIKMGKQFVGREFALKMPFKFLAQLGK